MQQTHDYYKSNQYKNIHNNLSPWPQFRRQWDDFSYHLSSPEVGIGVKNLTGNSNQVSQNRDFVRSGGNMSYRLVDRCHGSGFAVMLFNSLGPSDVIWRCRSWSTLVQAMACCLTATSHYLNQCWLIISKVLWHSSEDIIIRRVEDTNQ